MTGWQAEIDWRHPCWEDFVGLINKLDPGRFPNTSNLNQLMPAGVTNRRGLAIRFACSDDIPGVSYEHHIYSTGEVSTRSHNWHDLFNALVWVRYPRLKSAMNALHMAAQEQPGRGERGSQRDALTLFDECGVIVVAGEYSRLEQLSERRWDAVFSGSEKSWESRFRVFIVGHAMLEKFLQPYKAMTANALLVHVPDRTFEQSRPRLRSILDESLSRMMLAGKLFRSPAQLSPLPLAGIPGWWRNGVQDDGFYADRQVFRQPPGDLGPALIHSLQAAPD